MEIAAEKLSVIIADDHTLFINGLCMLLQNEPDIEIMNIAVNGREVLSLLHTHTPDLILLDINMPGLNGFEVLKQVKSYYPKIKVVMLSTYNEEHLIEKAKAGGANGYKMPKRANCCRYYAWYGTVNRVSLINNLPATPHLMKWILF